MRGEAAIISSLLDVGLGVVAGLGQDPTVMQLLECQERKGHAAGPWGEFRVGNLYFRQVG